jgi:hypothetical protein
MTGLKLTSDWRRLSQFLVLGIALHAGCQSKPRWDEHARFPNDRQESRPLATDVASREESPVSDNAGNENPSNPPTEQTVANAEGPVNLRPEQFSQRLPNRRQLRTDKSDPAMYKQLAIVGRDLAKAAPVRDIKFEFLPLQNTQPRVHHNEGGKIYVTTGLLERVTDKNELAAILAMEMAESLIEQQQSVLASAAAEGWTNRNPNSNSVEQVAAQLLDQAGYRSSDLASAKTKLTAWNPPERREVSIPQARQLAN